MAYVASSPETYENTSVGSGECVALVQVASGAPTTPTWFRGKLVKGDTTLARGTAIAVFDADGTYGNHTDGSSHAAIYLGQDSTGLQVLDQWNEWKHHVKTPHMASQRTINFRGYGRKVNDGNQFHVIQ